jgi:hypothetical protein
MTVTSHNPGIKIVQVTRRGVMTVEVTRQAGTWACMLRQLRCVPLMPRLPPWTVVKLLPSCVQAPAACSVGILARPCTTWTVPQRLVMHCVLECMCIYRLVPGSECPSGAVCGACGCGLGGKCNAVPWCNVACLLEASRVSCTQCESRVLCAGHNADCEHACAVDVCLGEGPPAAPYRCGMWCGSSVMLELGKSSSLSGRQCFLVCCHLHSGLLFTLPSWIALMQSQFHLPTPNWDAVLIPVCKLKCFAGAACSC